MDGISGLADLVREIKQASEAIVATDENNKQKIASLEASINELYKKVQRPGTFTTTSDESADERKSAIEMCRIRHQLISPKLDVGVAAFYEPGAGEIEEALTARRALKNFFHHGKVENLDATQKKSLTARRGLMARRLRSAPTWRSWWRNATRSSPSAHRRRRSSTPP